LEAESFLGVDPNKKLFFNAVYRFGDCDLVLHFILEYLLSCFREFFFMPLLVILGLFLFFDLRLSFPKKSLNIVLFVNFIVILTIINFLYNIKDKFKVEHRLY
jgi:hypothetical protein